MVLTSHGSLRARKAAHLLSLPVLPVPRGRAARRSWGTWGMVTHLPVSPGRGVTLQGARGLLVMGRSPGLRRHGRMGGRRRGANASTHFAWIHVFFMVPEEITMTEPSARAVPRVGVSVWGAVNQTCPWLWAGTRKAEETPGDAAVLSPASQHGPGQGPASSPQPWWGQPGGAALGLGPPSSPP